MESPEHLDDVPNLSGLITLLSVRPVFNGQYSSVFKAIYRDEHVAVKVLKQIHGAKIETMQRKLRRERITWGSLHHPNVLPLYGFASDHELFQPYGAFISPWRANGNAYEFLKERGRDMEASQKLDLWTGVVTGVNYLHNYTPVLIHGDLKSTNIMIDNGNNPQICDFGLVSIFLKEGSSGMTTTSPHTGTDRYLAYELMIDGDPPAPTTASDIFALGCVGLEFYFLQTPYAKHKNNMRGQIFRDIKAGIPPAARPQCCDPRDEPLWDLLDRCWARNPADRVSAQDVLTTLQLNAAPEPVTVHKDRPAPLSHHRGGDHKCSVCGSTFTRSQHVARHMRSHTGDRPYECVHCGDQFARSDLLSRHVNKCHSIDKKTTNQPSNYRRKQQQQREPAVGPATHHTHPQVPSLHPTGRPLYAQDEFAQAVYQQSPRRYSNDPVDPPSLPLSSVTSMSSASLDSLPHSAPSSEPVFHLPQHQLRHCQPQASRQWGGGQSGMPAYSFLPSNDHAGNLPIFKQEPYQPQMNGEGGVQHYNDLPTPPAYPDGPFRLDPFIPYQSQTLLSVTMDNGIYMQTAHQAQDMPNTHAMPNGRQGEFSSAFGLMSLDDAAVLAGLSTDGAPFFETQTSSTDGLQNVLPSNDSFASVMSGFGSSADPNQNNNAQTPNTKEREMRTVREMWAEFLRDPTTGLNPDGTEMGKPEFPTPPSFQQHPNPHQHLHRRSSSYSGAVGSLAKAMGQSINQYAHSAYPQPQRQLPSGSKSPQMPTAQHALHGGTNVVKKLEDQASNIDVDSHMAGIPAIPGAGLGALSPGSLRGYEEAILSRKAPVLKLPAKFKTRESSGSADGSVGGTGTTGSIVLPSISQSARRGVTVGGGVASLSIQQQQQLPIASGASGVLPGSTPNTAFYSSQVHDRPIIAIPKSRSRSTTANSSGSRPNTAGTGSVNSAHGSQPSSRPGTGSSNGGGGNERGRALPPYHQYNYSQSSPHPMPNAHSLPSSRPPTSRAPSPSYPFAFAPPPQFHNQNQGSNQAYASFQPGSLPTDSIISPGPLINPTSQQLVIALSNAGMLDSSTSKSGRPTYKRLASQVLEPVVSRHPYLRRGDTNFNPTLEGGASSDAFESEGMSDAGGSERSFGYGRGHGGAEYGGHAHESSHGANAFMKDERANRGPFAHDDVHAW